MGRIHQWIRVTRSKPCPICEKTDYCTRSADGTLVCCMRVEGRTRSANKLGGWIHRLSEPLPEINLPPKPKPVNADWTAEATRMYGAGTKERKRLARQLGLQLGALEQLVVGFGWDSYRKVEFSSWPEWSAEGTVVGIVRRYRDGAKKIMRGGHHGLYYGDHPLAMPGPVLLPEGGSDTAALLGLGANVIGRPSNTGGVDELAKMLKGIRHPIIVLGERDRRATDCECGTCMQCWPGLAGAKLTAESLALKIGKTVNVRMFPCAKDAREWVRKNERATPVDVFNTLYRPAKDACRVCGNEPPHEQRILPDRIEVVCRECRTLLENLKP